MQRYRLPCTHRNDIWNDRGDEANLPGRLIGDGSSAQKLRKKEHTVHQFYTLMDCMFKEIWARKMYTFARRPTAAG
jgi:hypothetical protein